MNYDNRNVLTKKRVKEIVTLNQKELYALLDELQNTIHKQEYQFVLHCCNISNEIVFIKVTDHNRKFHDKPILQFSNRKQELYKRGFVATTNNNDYYYGDTKNKALKTALKFKNTTYPCAKDY